MVGYGVPLAYGRKTFIISTRKMEKIYSRSIATLFSIFTKIHGKAPCTPYNSPKALPHCQSIVVFDSWPAIQELHINIATSLSVRLSLTSGWWTDIAVPQKSLKLAGMIKEDKTYSAPYTGQYHIQGQDVTYLGSNKHF